MQFVRGPSRGAGLELCASRFPCCRNETCQRELDCAARDSLGTLQDDDKTGYLKPGD